MAAFRTRIIILTLFLLPAKFAESAQLPEPKTDARKPKTDIYGDPLPEGAVARLGTIRLRHASQVVSVAYSPDGKRLATMGYDHAVRIWQTSTGKEMHHFHVRGDATMSWSSSAIAFSSDSGKLAAASGRGSDSICLWDVISGKERNIRIPEGKTAYCVNFSPDGNTLAAICLDEKAKEFGIHLWQVETGKELSGFKSPRSVGSLAFAPDGKSLAVSMDNAICLCDPLTGRILRTLRKLKEGQSIVVYSTDGTLALASQDEKAIRLWDTSTGREKHVLQSHEVVTALAYSVDGKRLVSACLGDGSFTVWDTASGKKILTHHGISGVGAGCVALSADGKTVAEGSINCVYSLNLWDVATGKEVVGPQGHSFPIGFVAFVPEGKIVTSGANSYFDRDLRVWEAATSKPLGLVREEH
jgi:WD40 repeat protein